MSLLRQGKTAVSLTGKKRGQDTIFPGDIAAFNRLPKKLRDEIGGSRDQEWLDKVRSLTAEDGSLWRMTRALCRNKGQQDDGLTGPVGM